MRRDRTSALAVPPIENLPPTFEPVEQVASSGESEVAIIRKRDNGELFLLKYLKPVKVGGQDDVGRALRFKREVDLVSSLDHQNIAKPSFTFAINDSISIGYPYRKGRPLSSIFLSPLPFPPPDALHIANQLLAALEYIHARGIIHCDISPNNIYIDEDKGVQLLDFGLSLSEDEAAQLPEGRVIGTLPFLSPEQMGFTDFKIDTRSDLYCVALCLYRMLSGRMPFNKHDTTVEELLKHSLRTEVEPVHKIPASLNKILLKALRPTPSERYQTATGFRHDVVEAMDHVKNEAHKEEFVAGLRDAIVAVNRSRLFVARGREVDMLRAGFQQLLRRNYSSFCIHGKSGIGKTEIVREFRRSMNEERAYFISAKCNSFTSRQPYSVLKHLMLEFAAKVNSEGRERIAEFSVVADKLLADYSGVISKIIPDMRPFFTNVLPIDVVEPEKEADRTAHVLHSMVTAACMFKPLVIFIDDLQWIDRVSFEIIRRMLADRVLCMIVFTLRSDNLEGDLFIYEQNVREIGIQRFLPVLPFSRADISDFIATRFGEVFGLERLAALLVKRTDRSPFSIAEAFRFLVNNSFLVTTGSTWSFSDDAETELPETLDPVDLILRKIDRLNADEMQWLATASLAEGKFQSELIERVSGLTAAHSAVITEGLEEAGFIIPQFGGGYRFSHDRIQEFLRNRVPDDNKFQLYEKFGEAYETAAVSDKDFLFHAAEAYFKSKNLQKAMVLSYESAKYAMENVALDIAARYFVNAQMMATQCIHVGILPAIDTVKMAIEHGDVLKLTGRNEQALNMFKELLKKGDSVNKIDQVNIKYRIGAIHHSMGNFELAIASYFEALDLLGIKYPKNNSSIVIALLFEMVRQLLYSVGINAFLPKSNNLEKMLSVKILNKLAYSLYYKNILLVQFSHYKALNIAATLVDCAEKAETFTGHIVSSFVFLLKKRAFSYLKKTTEISKFINRNDALAFAQSFGGVAYYYNGEWEKGETSSTDAIKLYKSIGDLWGQVVPLENIIFIELKKGNFSNSIFLLQSLIDLDRKCGDRRGMVLAHIHFTYMKFLQEIDSYSDWAVLIEERESVLSEIPLVKAICNIYILKKLFCHNQLLTAYNLSDATISFIKRNYLFQEYVSDAFSDRCEILIAEYRNRTLSLPSQLSLSNRQLFREFRKSLFSAFFRGVMYPAHLGAAIRAFAWYNAFKKRDGIARHFFQKAISRHHSLGMRYEEAKSLREFACYYEDRHQPGLARDYFNQAYKLFEKCEAYLECTRMEEMVDTELVKVREPRTKEKATTSGGSCSAVDQIRVDMLYEVSLSLANSENLETLLQKIVGSMIKATGAQYGYLRLEGDDVHEKREFVVDFNERLMSKESIPYSASLIRMAAEQKAIVISEDVPSEPDIGSEVKTDESGNGGGGESGESGKEKYEKSAMCVPLIRGDKYFGCVYLSNTLVAGLFSENARKAARIIAAQAGFVIENTYLMEEYRRLNLRLEDKVKRQTKDLSDKHEQLVQANIRLVESERMKELLSGTIVHDIKNFAAGLSGNIKLLSYKNSGDKKTARTVDLVVESCADILNLASNLLDINKMDEGKLVLTPRTVYFEELAAIIQKYRENALFEEKKIAVKITPPKNEFSVLADFAQIDRIFQNLISNAAKYTEENGLVEISFAKENKENVISFFSSGAAVPFELKQTIFEKYSRVEGKATQHSKGLGLFFCKMIMDAHKERIWVETDEKGNYFKLGFKKSGL